MTQVYGERWKKVDERRLGSGGQGEVFRVVDQSGKLDGEYALKRVINPKRHQRFLNEIEAIQRLNHPNVIKLVDHSALDHPPSDKEKQYIVMPIARGKDLSDSSRLASYKGLIDSTLQVARQIASALIAAHSQKIIHRDIKPKNILFTGIGNELWVTDFGIALLQDAEERPTESGEVVGPWSFMAPELEFGGKLDVTPAADIYSLGKVIFYILSCGGMIPRERIHEDYFNAIFDGKGERHRRLKMLLSEMICPLENRISNVQQVEDRLKAIEDYERQASSLPISEGGRNALAALQASAAASTRAKQESTTNSDEEQRRLKAVRESFLETVSRKLSAMAADTNTPDLQASSNDLSLSPGSFRVQVSQVSMYYGLCGVGLTVEFISGQRAGKQHTLMVILCSKGTGSVTFNHGLTPVDSVAAIRDHDLGVLVAYMLKVPSAQNDKGAIGFLTRKALIGTMASPATQNQRHTTLTRVSKAFYPNKAIHLPFKTSQWLDYSAKFEEVLTEGIDAFLDLLASPDVTNAFFMR